MNIIMKPVLNLLLALILITPFKMQAQTAVVKPSLALLEIDTRNTNVDNEENPVTAIVRKELEKLDRYQVMDKYDIEYKTTTDSLKTKLCFSKICLVSLGKKLEVEKMFTGNIQVMSKQIIITFKLLDVASNNFEKVQINEFLLIPSEIRSMIRITMNDMFGIANEAALVAKLTKKDDYENSINTPYEIKLRTDGPRIGVTVFTGGVGEVIRAEKNDGGYHAYPFMMNFGYQFEKQYINSGNFQALVEVIPMVTGLDQGLFIPSVTGLLGFRNNKNGLEFALGPTLNLIKEARVYTDSLGRVVVSDGTYKGETQTKFDSRGDYVLTTSFVFAVGKTFKSGKLNIPVNAFVVPSREGIRFGASFGFNARNRVNYNVINE
jgi:hypothetical protein